jgi:acetyl-CoA C-acetyltransferase
MEVTRSVNAALLTACHAIQAGAYNTVLVGGIEKMTDRWDKIRDDLMLLEDPWSYYAGGTPEAHHELMLRAYSKKYGITGDDLGKLYLALAQVAVKNHAQATKNEYAQFQRKITIEQVLSAREAVHKPLGLYDFAPISDGASALILTNEATAKKITEAPVYVLGCSSATDYLNFPTRDDLTHFTATKVAMKSASKMAGVNPLDISVAEVYDLSTVMEMVSMEDLGFCELGTAWTSIRGNCEDYDGYYEINGKKLFVNTNGGLKADGNPLGATGGAQIFEIFRQLRGEAGARQINFGQNSVPCGCALEFEGFGTKAYVSIFGRE